MLHLPPPKILQLIAIPILGVASCATQSTNDPSSSPVVTTITTSETIPSTAPADLSALAPRSDYGIFDSSDASCALLAGSGPTDPVPVASTFKLWVLDAIAREIATGTIAWDTPVTVTDDLRSDPSGVVYGYLSGQEVPVSEFAELMISISDNTATDHLIDLVGRDAIGDVILELAPDGANLTLPLLSTADMARLKFVDPDLGREYASLGPAARKDTVADLAERAPLPWLDDPTIVDRFDLSTPSLVDEIGWFASGPDICRTMVDLERLAAKTGLEPLHAILTPEAGLPPSLASAWTTTWFKGGSEPGVLAFAYRLATDDLDRVVVIALSDPDATLMPRPDGQQIIESILAAAG